MAVTKQQARKVRQPVVISDHAITGVLDGTTTQEVLVLSIVAERMTVQSDGTLAGNLEVSVNGTNWHSAGSFLANALTNATFSGPDHLFRAVRITRTGGSGKLHLVVK
jgi:hypothetical protein